MRKIALFVEGQSELIFVREFLLKVFDFQVSVKCFNLISDNLSPAEYSFSTPGPPFHFEIINVGNDVAVLSRILRREKSFWAAGFDKIVGLRDMYSRAYREETSERVIDSEINLRFQQGAIDTINTKAVRPGDIHFSFAIMEIEAWILALGHCFQTIDEALTFEFINEKLSFDLNQIDPETTFFHPANKIEEIYALVGREYQKKKGDISAIMSSLQKNDFKSLYTSDKCASFNHFVDALPPVLN